jgi:hypothetical protein
MSESILDQECRRTLRSRLWNSWLTRVIRKLVWLLGLLPTLIDYVSTYLRQYDLPAWLEDVLDLGVSWQATVVLVAVGVGAAAYLVHRDEQRQLEDALGSAEALRSSVPLIEVGWQFAEGQVDRTLEIGLGEIPAAPDFDQLMEAKRAELMGKAPVHPAGWPSSSYGTILSGLESIAALASQNPLSEPNPNYADEVESYLEECRDHLELRYELELDRAFPIAPVVYNRGGGAASRVVVELSMPPMFRRAKDHHRFSRSDPHDAEIADDWEQWRSLPPPAPQPYKSKVPFYPLDIATPNLSAMEALESIQPIVSLGPFFDQERALWKIRYEPGDLVPRRLIRDLDVFWLWAAEAVVGDAWTVGVAVYASELPEGDSQELTIKFVARGSD